MSIDKKIIEDLNKADFIKDFLAIFVRNGYGSLPKREIELLILQLMHKHSANFCTGKEEIYNLARQLKISPKRLQNLFDELSYRDSEKTEDWCKEQLKEILQNAELTPSGNAVKFQIDEGLIRDYATAKVRAAYGIVDTSFNTSVIKISGEQFTALALEIIAEKERKAILKKLEQVAKSETQKRGAFRKFIDGFAESAGKQAGRKTVDLGFAVLTGGLSEVTTLIASLSEVDG